VVEPLVELLRQRKIPETRLPDALTTIALKGEGRDLAMILDLAMRPSPAAGDQRVRLLEALSTAARQRNVRPEGDLDRVGGLLEGEDDGLRAAAAQAAGAWKVASARPRLVAIARDDATSAPLRRAAIEALAQIGGAESRREIERLASHDSPPRVQDPAIVALAAFDLKDAASRAAKRLESADRPAEVEGLLTRFLQLRQGSRLLANAVEGRSISADVAKVALRAARSGGREDPKLIEALTRAGGLKAAAGPPSAEEMARLVADVARLGDPARGEAVFRRKELNCLKCHAVAGAGGQVGPGLESIGASAPVDYLVDSLLQPGKAVKENYHAVTVATSDGKVLTGIKRGEREGALILRDAEDRELAVPLSSIEEQKEAGSLMPGGVTESLTRGEFLDLVRFLSELGKIGPYSVGKERVFRRWRVLEPTPKSAELMSRTGLDSAVEGGRLESWVPAYSQVSGVLPLDSLVPSRTYQGLIGMASAEVDVSTAGPIALALDSPEGLRVWIDGSKVEVAPRLVSDLPAGRHTITISVSLGARSSGVRCALEDVPGSPARAQVVVGK
jgi:putative heme-binding domain-containing protein